MSDVAARTMQPYVGAIVARSISQVATNQCGIDLDHADSKQLVCLVDAIDKGVRAFLADTAKAEECVHALRKAMADHTGLPNLRMPSTNTASSVAAASFASQTSPFGTPAATAPFGQPAPATSRFAASAAAASAAAAPAFGTVRQAAGTGSRRIDILQEFDIVTARGETKSMCAELGFPALDQVKIATVVSELARNIVQYAGTGFIELTPIVGGARNGIEIISQDRGKGIPNLNTVMSGDYDSKTGMGVGLLGTKRLMDEFDIDTGPNGTRIVARRFVL